MQNRREFLRAAAAMAIAWPATGCTNRAGEQRTSSRPAQQDTTRTLTVKIFGGYALVFNPAHDVVEIAAIKMPTGATAACALHHPMGLHVEGVEVQTSLGTLPGSTLLALPAATLTFSGIQQTGSGLKGFANTAPASAQVPTASAPNAAWNDLCFVPSLGNAMENWRDRTDARLRLTTGTLTIVPPSGTMKSVCWQFKPDNGRPPLPMVEAVTYRAPFTGDTIQLLANGNPIVTLTATGDLTLQILGPPHPGGQSVYKEGEAVAFYGMFSELVDPSRTCAQRPIPVLTKCSEAAAGKGQSSGSWCPTGRVVAFNLV